jgi:hypothetical protein
LAQIMQPSATIVRRKSAPSISMPYERRSEKALARFQGNIHAGSDRAAATILFLVLLVLLLLAVWWAADAPAFMAFWENVKDALD